jgi:protein tyrosine phosphatase (PTP) superfamily phosphohydrolase (DUF442 family)
MNEKVPMEIMPSRRDNRHLSHVSFFRGAGAKSLISLRRLVIAVISLLILITGGFFLYVEEQGNFHAVTPGEAYRSAQMDRDELEYYIDRYHLKSILNLRGKNADSDWYNEEMRVSSERGIVHYDMDLSASRGLTDEEVRRLMEIFDSAPRPILIHCKSGADRSGLVSAMWQVVVDKISKGDAKKQLSILYGHLSVGPTAAMDRFFERWQPSSPSAVSQERKGDPAGN